ncbi:MAG: hypothetical protein D6759_17605 [Chloroflexi bacterium]|nr:MAG: hypothetical protein D6759_17605 [Chloroflexota bacterium]
MKAMSKLYALTALILVLSVVLTACGGGATPTKAPQPTKPPAAKPTKAPMEKPTAAPTKAPAKKEIGKITVGTNAEYPPFEFVDESGNIVGFDIDLMKAIADAAGFEVEFVNTRWDGIFVALASGEFDAVISAATITEERKQTVDFSDPYFNAGQIIAVRADNTDIKGPEDLDGKVVGVQQGTTGDIWVTENTKAEVKRYDEITLAFQALANGDVDAVVNDAPTSADIIKANPEMNLKLVGEPFTEELYGIAVRKDFPELLEAINKGLAEVKASGKYDEIYNKWFGLPKAEEKPGKAMAETIIIGTTDKVTDLDPANSYDFHTWEVHHNTMDTLLHYIPGTTDLEPGLAKDFPEVSEDGLEYTFHLKEGLKFPDGTPFNAEAVKWSIDRVMALGGDPNWLVTSFVDHVEVVDEYTVKFVLKKPVNYFPLLVATQPYSPVSPNCYSEDKFDSDSTCGGIGPYTITKWERDVELDLTANPDYPGPAPKTKNIIVKYFADATTMRLALENGEIDIATKTLNPTDYEDLRQNPDFQVIEGPGAQIRYLCFNHTIAPFDNPLVRQAIAYAVDRDAVANKAFLGTHQPLYSMVPMGMWAHIDAFPKRDLEKAKELLQEAGYSADNPLEIDLWWTPTHYGDTEADVAAVIKEALEETGMIKVNLQSAEWATYVDQFGSMGFYLLGWYPDYLDPDNYTTPFADSEASKDIGIFYASDKMDSLLQAEQAATDLRGAEREKIFKDIQELWAEDIPTIPLTQGTLLVVAKKDVKGIVLDPNMLFHYFLVYK